MTTVVTTISSGPYFASSQTTFAVTFQSISEDEIAVLKDGVEVGGYVFNRNDDGTGSVLFSIPQTGEILIRSDPSFTETTEFSREGAFYPDQINNPIDDAARRDLWLVGQQERYIRAPEGEFITELPPAAERENRILQFGSTGYAIDLLSSTAYVASIGPALSAYIGNITKGDPGGNVSAIGLFTAASTLSIPVGTNLVRTTGYATSGVGSADYVADAAVNAAYVTANPRTSFISSNARGFRYAPRLGTIVHVDQLGAVGDGVTNDSDAISAASAVINTLDGGVLELAPRTYIVGKQTFAGATGLGYAYQGIEGPIRIVDCAHATTINGNGAILKVFAGYKFGSFDPVTGLAVGTSSNADTTSYATWGIVFLHDNPGGVSVRDLELDGQSGTVVLGGRHPDGSGWQVPAYGINAYGNGSLTVENVYTHHHPTDGLVIGYTGLTTSDPRKPVSLRNVRSEYNGRQGLSWVGGNGLVAVNCAFNHTGRGGFVSAPGAGVDLEAESAVIRNGLFMRCEFIDNAGAQVIADSGDTADVTFHSCKFIGTTAQSVWPSKPGFRFHDCLFVGEMTSCHGNDNPDLATQFYGCRFSSDTALSPTGAVYGTTLMDLGGSDKNVLFDTCVWDARNAVTIAQGTGEALFNHITATQVSASLSIFRGQFRGINTIASTNNDFTGSGAYRNYGRIFFNGVELPATPQGSDIVAENKKLVVTDGGGGAGNHYEISIAPAVGAVPAHVYLLAQNIGIAWIPVHYQASEHHFQFNSLDMLVVGNGYVDMVTAELRCNGTKVVGVQQGAIANPAGGTTVDTEARNVITNLLTALRTHGLIDT